MLSSGRELARAHTNYADMAVFTRPAQHPNSGNY